MKRFLTLTLLILAPALSGPAFAQVQDPEVELIPAQRINEGQRLDELNIFARPADLAITTFTVPSITGITGVGANPDGQITSPPISQDFVPTNLSESSAQIQYSVMIPGDDTYTGQFTLTVVKVELPLTAGTPLADMTFTDTTPMDVDLVPAFVNTDNDDLTYEIRRPSGGADDVVSVAISATMEGTATLTPVGGGSTTVEICASDVVTPQPTDFLCDSFTVTVDRPPLVISGDREIRTTTSDFTLFDEGGTGTRRLSGALTLNVPGTFARRGGGFGTYGLFTITAAGEWAYSIGLFGAQLGRVRALLPGQVAYEARTVRATDEDGFTRDTQIIFLFTGANNRPNPSITSPVTPDTTVAAGAVVAVEGTVVDEDDMVVDFPPAPTVLWSTNPPMGAFADPTALATTWSVTPPATATDIELILMVTDAGGLSSTATTTLTLHPTNAFSGVTTGAVTEDDNPVSSTIVPSTMVLQTGGTLTVAGGVTAQTNFACTDGIFNIDAAGVWTYEVRNDLTAVQGLGAGETRVDTCPVAAVDTALVPATVNVAITITGVNDAPTLTLVASSPTGIGRLIDLFGDELNPGGVITLTATAVDPDVNDALTFAWTEVPEIA